MPNPPSDDVTTLLQRLNKGDEAAMDGLMDSVHAQLRAMAHRHMQREFGQEQPGVTLQPTALVNETYIKLIKQRQKYDNRGQFFAIATKLMIRVLMDYHRQRKAAKRGGGWVRVPFDPDRPSPVAQAGSTEADIVQLAAALKKLEKLDSRKADVIKLRVLWGLSVGDVAESLNVSRATIERDWSFAKAWLKKELAEGTRP